MRGTERQREKYRGRSREGGREGEKERGREEAREIENKTSPRYTPQGWGGGGALMARPPLSRRYDRSVHKKGSIHRNT